MRLTFLNHASIMAENKLGEVFITDPWYSGKVFNDSWELLENDQKISEQCIEYLNNANYIWISHEHPDHLHFPTLKKITEEKRGRITILFRKEDKNNVHEAIRKMGFKVLEVQSGELINVGGYDLFTLDKGYDTAMYLSDGETAIFNQNDCKLNIDKLSQLKERFGKIDFYFYQFGMAGYYKNSDDIKGFEVVRNQKMTSIHEYIDVLKPDIFVPFASYIYFCHRGNQYLNIEQVTTNLLVDKFNATNVKVQLPTPLEEIVKDGTKNVQSISYWDDKLKSKRECIQSKFTSDDIKAAFECYNNDIEIEEHRVPFKFKLSNFISNSVIGKSQWRLLSVGSENIYLISAKKKGFSKKIYVDISQIKNDNPDSESNVYHNYKALAKTHDADYIVDVMQMLYALKMPWGHDTLNISACFYILRGKRGHLCSLFKRYYRRV